MKNIKAKLIVCIFFISTFSTAQTNSRNVLQFVESIPIETDLGIESTKRTLDVWLEMINNAERTIDIEIFYLSNKSDELLDEIINALKKAAKRGVIIRIITDAKFAAIYPETLDLLNKEKNVDVRRIIFFNNMDGVQHGKYFVVDKMDVFIGSQNFDWRSLKHIHELGVRIQNEKMARLILKIFEADWELCKLDENTNPDFSRPVSTEKQINSKNPVNIFWMNETIKLYPIFSPYGFIFKGMENEEAQLLSLINNAQSKIYILLLSYDPVYKGEFYPALDNALRSAAVRGVQVNILLSDWNKSKPAIDFLKSLQVLPSINIKLSTIPQYSGGFIPFARVEHCKFMVVDDSLSWIGTSNWAKNYFYNSRNIGIIFKGKSVNSLLEKVFLKSWESDHTYLVDPMVEYKVPQISE